MSNDNVDLDQFEVGGSFFELIEFSLDRHLPDGRVIKGIYGVNVAKVREVVHLPNINPLASRIPGVAGIFELRGVPIPAINLCQILGDPSKANSADSQIVVTEFSAKRAGFIVSTTHRIRRVAWDKVMPPSSDNDSCMSGMILIEDNCFLFILDLEKILSDIEGRHGDTSGFSPYSSSQAAPIAPVNPGPEAVAPPRTMPGLDSPGILFVDDSKLVLNNVSRVLSEQGYRVMTAANGFDAFNILQEFAAGEHALFGSLNCMITDVEMPMMDGLTLVKKVREDATLKELPVLLHTSLSGEVTQTAAQSVGANGYVVKNDVRALFDMVSDLIKHKSYSIGG